MKNKNIKIGENLAENMEKIFVKIWKTLRKIYKKLQKLWKI